LTKKEAIRPESRREQQVDPLGQRAGLKQGRWKPLIAGILFFSMLNLSCQSNVSGLKPETNADSRNLEAVVAKEIVGKGLFHSTHLVAWAGREYLLGKGIQIELKGVGFEEMKKGRFWGVFRPTEKGAGDLREFTKKHVGEDIAFLAGSKVLFVGRLHAELQGNLTLPAYNDAGWSASEKEEIARHFEDE